MDIRKLLSTTWEQACQEAVVCRGADIFPGLKIVVFSRGRERHVSHQLVFAFNENGAMELVTSCNRVTPLTVSAYLNARRRIKSLRKDGILCRATFEKGWVTCTYSRVGWAG